jgi:hypothetical protein
MMTLEFDYTQGFFKVIVNNRNKHLSCFLESSDLTKADSKERKGERRGQAL